MIWEPVMGLEVHAELATKSKIFCSCATAFGAEPNTHVCPVCSGAPGSLPKLNREVVEYALKTGLALNCKIRQYCKFDRKNYFYPDLPKAYQVSQLYAPVCYDGHLEINADGQKKTIRIRELHIEEDAGKLVHDADSGVTFMDFNRCGVPLVEIVTQPDFSSNAEVLAFLEKLRETLLYLGVCDCKMQEGSLRADINLSVRPTNGALGVRTEMKNLNSFRAVSRAIEYEAARQVEILNQGGEIRQETRRWDDEGGFSYGMRSKENAQDYRYFPEPDLLPITIDNEWLRRVEAGLPELAQAKRARYIRDFGLSDFEASVLTGDKNIADLFENVANLSKNPLEAAHLVTGEIMRLLNQTNTLPEDLSIDGAKLATLITLVAGGKINRNAYKETVEAVFTRNVNPKEYIKECGLMMVSDEGAVTSAVAAALSENPDALADYRAGKEKAFGFLMGQIMKKLSGAGDPELVRKVLKNTLEN